MAEAELISKQKARSSSMFKDFMKASWLVANTPLCGVLVLQTAVIFDVRFDQHKLMWHAHVARPCQEAYHGRSFMLFSVFFEQVTPL